MGVGVCAGVEVCAGDAVGLGVIVGLGVVAGLRVADGTALGVTVGVDPGAVGVGVAAAEALGDAVGARSVTFPEVQPPSAIAPMAKNEKNRPIVRVRTRNLQTERSSPSNSS